MTSSRTRLDWSTSPGLRVAIDADAVLWFAGERGIESVAALARAAGISQSYLSRILRGERPCRVNNLLALAKALDVAPRDLVVTADQRLAESLLDEAS